MGMTQDRCTCEYHGNNHSSWCAERREATLGSWVTRAACSDYDLSTFFPTYDGDDHVAEARKVCLDCPVRLECAEYALASNEEFGIWGTLTPRERRIGGRKLLAQVRRAMQRSAVSA